MVFKSKVRTCLWFESDGQAAAEFYITLIPNSEIQNIVRPNPIGPALVVEFSIGGAPFMALNGGPTYKHSPAASIPVLTTSQEETDGLWEKLCANGGRESQCGWLIDRFGVSWQIVPETLPRLLGQPDNAAAERVRSAFMQMRKIDIGILEKAASELGK